MKIKLLVQNWHWRFVLFLAIFITVTAGSTEGDIILAPRSAVEGRLIGDYGADWWNWAAIKSAATNPILDTTGEDAHRNQSGWADTFPVFFLAGTFGTSEVRAFSLAEASVNMVTL